jgi:hypothetical protein
MCHFAVALVRDIWKRHSLTLSSINELDEYHKWYVMMCVEGSSHGFPLNFRILDGGLEGIFNHKGSWEIGSFNNHDKSGKSNVSRKDNDANEY